ncbi:hypothetical protein [Rhizobium sp. Leaf341]|uniref:hypothetical protein n=1 Tax=Rhizobium sp. Leaf341 TaxID=1736344 RepID=UPI000716104D|nr:hypothetical protein [Rhizobium sp. Leaf341]KQR68896.1 hypothetical protein ASG03_06555 [Rhizobium sp. Leaf341]
MTSNILFLQTQPRPAVKRVQRTPLGALQCYVEGVIARHRLAAARAATCRALRVLPDIVRQDVAMVDDQPIKITELTHQIYSLD